MKKIIVVLFVFMSVQSIAQDLPKNFNEQVKKIEDLMKFNRVY
jgi:hypothetical protein